MKTYLVLFLLGASVAQATPTLIATYDCVGASPTYRVVKVELAKDGDLHFGRLVDLTTRFRGHEQKVSGDSLAEVTKSKPGFAVGLSVPPYTTYSLTLSPMILKTFANAEKKDHLPEFETALFHQTKESFGAAVFHCTLLN